jgi:hypothetical protein
MYNFTERLLKDSSRTSTAIQASFSVIIAVSTLEQYNPTQADSDGPTRAAQRIHLSRGRLCLEHLTSR